MAPPARTTRRVFRELGPQTDWLRLVGGLSGRTGFYWLDSALPDARLGRTSFAGAEPWAVLRADGARVQVEVRRSVDPAWPVGRVVRHGDPLELARELLPPPPDDSPPPVPFAGGAVAAFGYELCDPWETLPAPRGRGLDFPDLTLLAIDGGFAFDHLEGRAYATALGVGSDEAEAEARAEARLAALVEELPDGPAPRPAPRRGPRPIERSAGFDPESHAKAVRRVRERILAGDVYQACLTHRIDVPCAAAPLDVYVTLRERSPAPFAAFLQLPGGTLIGSSPERFLRVTPDGWAESRPIKGTRPRRPSPEADRAERRGLAASEKDRAENLMIVDLVRNDLGRVCEPGSVHVPELMSVETYATVFQMVSTVRGRLRDGCDALDAVRAAFPPGSMTGAPKLAAMTLLRELEVAPRGPYAGAVGYLDASGACDLSVVIRTALLPPSGGIASVHTGGGIVYDSEPHSEWEEAEDKARALLEAIADTSAATVTPSNREAG